MSDLEKIMAEISVLMGTYNESRRKTAQAIDSILSQSFTDFEFIIWDDGSDQNYYEWLKRYCKKDDRVLLFRNETNKGLATVLNQCLAHASGTYIARMDADDWSEHMRFEKQYHFLEKYPEYAMAGCTVRMFGEKGVWGIRRLKQAPEKTDFLHTSPFVHPSIMMRRAVMEELGGYTQEKWTLRAEDYELFMRLYAAGYCGYNLPEILLCYREDLTSYKKRKYRYRLNECIVRYRGFLSLGILKNNYRFVVKPLLVGLIPAFVMWHARCRRYSYQTVKKKQREMHK